MPVRAWLVRPQHHLRPAGHGAQTHVCRARVPARAVMILHGRRWRMFDAAPLRGKRPPRPPCTKPWRRFLTITPLPGFARVDLRCEGRVHHGRVEFGAKVIGGNYHGPRRATSTKQVIGQQNFRWGWWWPCAAGAGRAHQRIRCKCRCDDGAQRAVSALALAATRPRLPRVMLLVSAHAAGRWAWRSRFFREAVRTTSVHAR